MIIVAVDQRHINRRIRQRFRRFDAAKAGADDHDARARR